MNSSLVLHLYKRLPAPTLALSHRLAQASRPPPSPARPGRQALLHLICSGPLDQLIRLRKISDLFLVCYSLRWCGILGSGKDWGPSCRCRRTLQGLVTSKREQQESGMKVPPWASPASPLFTPLW